MANAWTASVIGCTGVKTTSARAAYLVCGARTVLVACLRTLVVYSSRRGWRVLGVGVGGVEVPKGTNTNLRNEALDPLLLKLRVVLVDAREVHPHDQALYLFRLELLHRDDGVQAAAEDLVLEV